MIQLTDNQKEILLKLGGSSSVEMVPLDIWNELLEINLIYKRSDGRYDLTEAGEHEYNQLSRKH